MPCPAWLADDHGLYRTRPPQLAATCGGHGATYQGVGEG